MVLTKLHISVALLGPMLAGAGTAGVAWATLGGRVSAIEAAHAELKPRVLSVEGAVQDLKVGQAAIQEDVKASREDTTEIREMVQRIWETHR